MGLTYQLDPLAFKCSEVRNSSLFKVIEFSAVDNDQIAAACLYFDLY